MKLFKGVYTALVTPFQPGSHQHIDEPSLRNLVDWQIQQGVHGLVACGTTGESATLSLDEKKRVIQIVIDQTQKRVPVIAGTGTNNTSESIQLTSWAQRAGADAILAVTPYYNKPTQEGLFRHYRELAQVGTSVILYHVPSRTSVSFTLDTLKRLSEVENIVAIKEATGSLDFASQILQETEGKLSLISGDDFTFLPLLSVGAVGVISVASNVVPKDFSKLYELTLKSKWDEAKQIHYKLYPFIQALFKETNPIPIKTALNLMNKMELEFRLPLCEMSKENKDDLHRLMQNLELV